MNHPPCKTGGAIPPDTQPVQRQCGDCNVCCKTLYVRDLNKPAGVPCKFLTSKGCGAYEHRWNVCKGFVCLWLRDTYNLFTDEHRPDQLGLILYGKTDPATNKQHINAAEVWKNAAQSDEAKKVIKFLEQFGNVQIIPAATPKNLTHDITLTVKGKTIEPVAA